MGGLGATNFGEVGYTGNRRARNDRRARRVLEHLGRGREVLRRSHVGGRFGLLLTPTYIKSECSRLLVRPVLGLLSGRQRAVLEPVRVQRRHHLPLLTARALAGSTTDAAVSAQYWEGDQYEQQACTISGLRRTDVPVSPSDEGRCPGPGQKPIVQIPQPGVPQIMTMEGKFVRAAYNNEGYVILGYQASNRSVGEEWMLLEVGITVLDKTPDYRLTRDALSLETPDGKTIPLPSVTEQREGNTQAIQQRAKVQRDSINYFPPSAQPGVRHRFLSRSGLSRAAVRRRGSQQRPRLSRPSLFQDPGRHRVWPALAQREVPEQPRARALSDPDRGRREAPLEELQEHREAGQRRVQAEEVTALISDECALADLPLRAVVSSRRQT